jgi:hypothetical protein
MVQGVEDRMIFGRVAKYTQAKETRMVQTERSAGFLFGEPAGFGSAQVWGECGEIDYGKIGGRGWIDDLNGLAGRFDEAGSERFVAQDDVLQRAGKSRNVKRPAQA